MTGPLTSTSSEIQFLMFADALVLLPKLPSEQKYSPHFKISRQKKTPKNLGFGFEKGLEKTPQQF